MKKIFLSALLVSSVLLAGCQNDTSNSPSSSAPAAQEEKLSVVTSFYPLAFFTEQIAGDLADVTNLTGDKNPHGYKISPKDRAKLSNADLVIYQGLGLESWAEDVIPELQKKNIAVLEASHGLSLLKTEDEHDDHDNHKEKKHENHDEEHDEHKDEHDTHEEHNHGEFDPHTWVDPVIASQIVEHIAEELISVDPKNTQTYKKNLQIAQEKLTVLDVKYKQTLANCSRSEALVSHNAFGYLESRYGFELHPIAGISPTDEPSAKLLAELKELAEHDGVTHVLTEKNNIQKYAQVIAAETNITMVPVNPMGITPQDGNYFDVSQKNLESIAISLECQ